MNLLMILLQAAMAAGFMLIVAYVVFLIVGVLIFTGIFMKLYWRIANKNENINKKLPYYKDQLPFIVSLMLSAVASSFIYYLVIRILLRNITFD